MLSGRLVAWLSLAIAVALIGGGLFAPRLRRATPVLQVAAADRDGAQMEPPGDPVQAIALSPDGNHHAWIETTQAGSSLWMGNDTGGRSRLLRRTDATDLTWSSDGQWLILPGPHKVSILTTGTRPGSGIVTRVGGDTNRRYLAADPHLVAVLIATEDDSDGDGRVDRYGLLRVRRGGVTDRLWAGRKLISGAIAAADGSVWLRLIGQDAVEIALIEPTGASRTIYRCRALERCSLVAAASRDEAYMVSSAQGDLDALYKVDAQGALFLRAVDPLAIGDAGDVALDLGTGLPAAVHIPYAGGRVIAAGIGVNPPLTAMRRRFPEASEVRIVAHAGGRWLIGIRDGRHPALSWSIATDDGGQWRALFPERETFEGDGNLPTRRLLSFAASDGMRLFAYVTRPPRHADAPLPLVVLVHGGPWSASPPGFHGTAASLANRGFLVIEPQFRASRGYGRRYMLAAGNDFGDGRVLRDIRDSADWMVSHGGADRSTIAIMGASFGGYAALLATTLWPDRFRGAVAAVPPAEFGWVSRYQAGLETSDPASLSLRYSLKSLGLDLGDWRVMQRLAMQSPMALAGRLNRPVLLLAGDRDRQVPIRSVAAYAAQLCRLKKPVTYYVAPGEGHHLGDDQTSRSARLLAEDFMIGLVHRSTASSYAAAGMELSRRACSEAKSTASKGAS